MADIFLNREREELKLSKQSKVEWMPKNMYRIFFSPNFTAKLKNASINLLVQTSGSSPCSMAAFSAGRPNASQPMGWITFKRVTMMIKSSFLKALSIQHSVHYTHYVSIYQTCIPTVNKIWSLKFQLISILAIKSKIIMITYIFAI